jgi:uncharacterized protein (TIGR00725 family)
MPKTTNICYVGVIGAGSCNEVTRRKAFDVGKGIAESGAVLVCGGLGGVMTAASEGAKSAGGITIGILPGSDRSEANEFIDCVIPTGLGEVRNVLVVRASDVVIALPGHSGTMSEFAFALKIGKPVIDFGDWNISGATGKANNAQEAVRLAIQTTDSKRRSAPES